MRGTFRLVDGLTATSLIRRGGEWKHPKRGHKIDLVYTEMFLQISRDYPSLPDVRTLKFREIRFFYDGLRNELIEHTKPKG